ncbi:MAG: flavodoxin family protein [Candidatus Thorarchaeota archaeon]|jgi:multimeric flavodoxin WrbA
MAKILGISGSNRQGGNTSILIQMALDAAQDIGADIEFIELADFELNSCKHGLDCYENGECIQDDGLNEIVAKMLGAHGIIMGSPVHHGTVTSQMKGFMDRVGRFAHLEGKVGASLVVARKSGADLALSQMHFFMLVKEMIIPGCVSWPIGFALNVGDIRSDTEAMRMAQQLGRRVASLADILVKVPVPWRYESRPAAGKARFGDEWRTETK